MRFLILLPLALAFAAPAVAQSGASTLTGRVVDAVSGAAVVGASVHLIDSTERRVATSTTDTAGVFRFLRVGTGKFTAGVTAPGYAATTTPSFVVDDDRPIDLLVRLGVDAVPLDPLTVTVRQPPPFINPALTGFSLRARRGIGGHFFTQDELEARRPRQLSDLLRTTGNFMVDNGRRMIRNNRTGCEPAVFLDGHLIFAGGRGRGSSSGLDALNTLHWPNVAGLELYAGPAAVPAEFTHVFTGCGVIAIWSRM
jgi:hypothetical protein